MKNKFILSILSVLCALTVTACSNGHTSSVETEIDWSEITANGVNEKLLYENLDIDILEKVANSLQNALKEELKEERENPEIIVTEGWTRIFGKKQYKEVVEMGKPAMKPLYWILYKSQNNGQYEYLCAAALCEISGIGGETTEIGTMKWSTAKEYLDLFTETVMKAVD